MSLQSITKSHQKAQTNWNWKQVDLHGQQHSAGFKESLPCEISDTYLSLSIPAFAPVWLRSFILHTLELFLALSFFCLWLSSQLYPAETQERQPTPRSSSATGYYFPALWRTHAGKDTRHLAWLLVTARPTAHGPAQHRIASVRITTLPYLITVRCLLCASVIPLLLQSYAA